MFAPTLTGLGERSHLLTRAVDLDTHIEDIINVIRWEELDDVILVGHSYGGTVITAVADRADAGTVSALVYVDGFVPNNGESLEDNMPEQQRGGNQALADAQGDGWYIPKIPAAFFNVNEADRDWVDSHCTAQPLASFQQKIRLDHEPGHSVPSIDYVLATDWAATPFAEVYNRSRDRGWTLHEIHSGHDIMLDSPLALSEILLHVADRLSAPAEETA